MMNSNAQLAECLLNSYRTRFRKLKALGDGALDPLESEDWHKVPSGGVNSIAVIIQHVSGNMRSRWTNFLTSDGEKADRFRDQEFEARTEQTPEELRAHWEAGWNVLLDTLAKLEAEDLTRTVTIRRQSLTVVDAINRQLGHYGYHVGQLVYLARMHCGDRWTSLSIAPGESEQYQAKADD